MSEFVHHNYAGRVKIEIDGDPAPNPPKPDPTKVRELLHPKSVIQEQEQDTVKDNKYFEVPDETASTEPNKYFDIPTTIEGFVLMKKNENGYFDILDDENMPSYEVLKAWYREYIRSQATQKPTIHR